MKQKDLETKVAELEQSIIQMKSLFLDMALLHKDASKQRDDLALAMQNVVKGCIMIAERVFNVENQVLNIKPLDLSQIFENNN